MACNYFCDGVDKAPQRSLFNALGMTKEEMDSPLVGIVSSYNEIVPGHMNIDKIVEAVKMGVAMAGGTPVVFPAIAVCDGIAMGHMGMKYSLVTRDLIADSTECMALAHHFDALVMIPNCDKNVPGLLMAAARVNVPTIFVSGGPMLAGHVKGKKTSLSSMFEAVGSYAAGTMTEEDVYEYEEPEEDEDCYATTCPTCEETIYFDESVLEDGEVICPNCGEKHYIFGKSNLEQVAKDQDVKLLAQIPMDPAMATAMDQGAVESLEKNYLEPVADAILAHEKG